MACSGAMYTGVPSATPTVVRFSRPVASLTALATPKSVTRAWRPESITFSGLMSRCTRPCWCAWLSASATSCSSRTTSRTGSSVSRSRRSRSDWPASYGIT
jgi:hypothetical protein